MLKILYPLFLLPPENVNKEISFKGDWYWYINWVESFKSEFYFAMPYDN